MVAGRPKKYNEDCMSISLSLPKSILEYIDLLATDANTSKNEIIINAISSSDKTILTKLTKDMIYLRDYISELTKNNEELLNKLKRSTFEMIYIQIQEDTNLNEFLSYFKSKYEKWIENGIEEMELLNQYELWLFENKKLALQNKSHLKIALKSWIKKESYKIVGGK